MTKIAPSMLSCDFSILGEEIVKIERCGADWVHLDVMDGAFVPNLTFGAPVIKCARRWTNLPFDAHLMIEDPARYVEDFARAGCDSITVHTEAGGDISATIDKIHDLGLKAGITMNPGTDVHDFDRYLDRADLVLIMTVNAGFGGQKFHEECVPKIEYVRRWADDHNPKLDISVDGGVNRNTGRICVEAGANVLVAGSALFGIEDMASEIALWKGYGPNLGR